MSATLIDGKKIAAEIEAILKLKFSVLSIPDKYCCGFAQLNCSGPIGVDQ